MPAPPIPTNQSAYRRAAASATSSSAISSAASGFASRAHRSAHRVEPGAVGEELVDERRNARDLALRRRRPRRRRARSRRAFFVWWSPVANRLRDEDGGQPGRGELPHGPAGARDREVGGAERGAEVVDERQQR